jgi:hypothetical protein
MMCKTLLSDCGGVTSVLSSITYKFPKCLRGPIPRSSSAIIQAFEQRTRDRARNRWVRSKRAPPLARIDPKLPSNRFLSLADAKPRRQISLLIRLRTGQAPLNKTLHRMKLVDSPGCEACGYCDEETVRHYLLECPAHERTRRKLRDKLGPQNAADLSYILSEKKAMAPLFAYIDETGRFQSILGTLTTDEHNRVID